MKKPTNYKEWRLANPKEWSKAKYYGWIPEICEANGWEKPYKYSKKRKPNGYWKIKENCIESAKKHKTLKSWVSADSAAVESARLNGWDDECTAHMNVYKVLTKEDCIANAKKYNGRWEWQKSEGKRHYNTAKVNKWLDECCEHMVSKQPPKSYWTKEKCIEVAKKYKYPSDFEKSDRPAHGACRRNGWYEECTAHMSFKIKPSGYWNNKERCIEVIKTCTSKQDLKKKSPSVTKAIIRNGWYNELTSHFESGFKWNRETLLEEANKYDTVAEFSKNANGAYQTAIKKGWKDYVLQNLKTTYKPRGYWNIKENVINEAKKYKNSLDWQKSSIGSITSARKNGWLYECTNHMK
tara:strand:+ start:277 stop:1332 length:1056 start_codon:yes stop_codon:yes gene_type:complete